MYLPASDSGSSQVWECLGPWLPEYHNPPGLAVQCGECNSVESWEVWGGSFALLIQHRTLTRSVVDNRYNSVQGATEVVFATIGILLLITRTNITIITIFYHFVYGVTRDISPSFIRWFHKYGPDTWPLLSRYRQAQVQKF